MIQRIQTVYLLMGILALTSLLFFDAIWAGPASETLAWFAPAVLGLAGLAVVVAVLAIFLYKDRARQRKTVLAVQLLTLVLALVVYLGLFLTGTLTVQTEDGLNINLLTGVLLPAIAYLMFLLARRGIDRDIALVKSMDRLR